MRIVLDTNVFISSLLGGNLSRIVDKWRTGKFTLLVSDAIAGEYLDVVNRPKFKISTEEIVTVTDYLLNTAEFITPEESINAIPADPTDNKFLEAAVAGKAKYIVSGDNHLLELGTFQGIPIITAREFLTKLDS